MKLQKETKRRYDDACGMAHALDLIGERWALHVMRELMLGPLRFSEIKSELPGISANVLTQRLEGLEAKGLVQRRRLPPPLNAQVYELTEWGYEAEPVTAALGRWATRSPGHDPLLPISAVSILLSFRALFDPGLAKGLVARIGFALGSYTYIARIDEGGITIARGPTEEADVTFTGTPAGLAGAVHGKVPLEALAQAGVLTVTGDEAIARRFLTLFPLPAKAA
jgi:DNA-binding HxlR family transcriptional regulator